MPASGWTLYNSAKRHIADGAIDLDTDSFMMALYVSASNAQTLTLSTKASVTSEVTEGFGYSSSGKALTGVTWGVGASAREARFNAAPTQWLAAGGSISNVKTAVIWKIGASGGAQKLLCWCQLSTAQFTITNSNSLTVTPSTNGIFELND